jgi:hypothetical protein
MKKRHLVALIVLASGMLLSSHPALALFSQQGPKLVGPGAVGISSQGESVSLSADGNTAIVGENGDNSGAGAAWVWTRSGGVWTQQGTKLVGSGAVGTLPRQGVSVSLSGDGNTAIVGGIGGNGVDGAAWVFASAHSACGRAAALRGVPLRPWPSPPPPPPRSLPRTARVPTLRSMDGPATCANC